LSGKDDYPDDVDAHEDEVNNQKGTDNQQDVKENQEEIDQIPGGCQLGPEQNRQGP